MLSLPILLVYNFIFHAYASGLLVPLFPDIRLFSLRGEGMILRWDEKLDMNLKTKEKKEMMMIRMLGSSGNKNGT